MRGRSKLGWGDLCGLSELDRNSAAGARDDVLLGVGRDFRRNRGEPKKGTPGNTFFFREGRFAKAPKNTLFARFPLFLEGVKNCLSGEK